MNNNYTEILEKIIQIDQKAIQDFHQKKISSTDLEKINNSNLSILKKIIKEIGFPTIKKTSENAYTAAILISLHCSDSNFIEEVAELLEKYTEEEIRLTHKAFLIDKARVIKNLPQIYGTQYKKESSGEIIFLPILNPEKVDELRLSVGLEPLSQYKNKASN